MLEIFDAQKHNTQILKTAQAVLSALGVKEEDVYIEITVSSEQEIKELNAKLRGIDAVTDVLSFQNIENISLPFDPKKYESDKSEEGIFVGEVFICLEKAKAQANEYGHSLDRELSFLTAHGLLHLFGYDHENEEKLEAMTKLTEEILSAPTKARPALNKSFRSGFVAVMGRPNAGKSTLINALVGEKVSIVSWKPQTTRDKIKGIYNDADSQIVFIDTPGLHKPQNSLGKYMMKNAAQAVEGTDCVLYIIDGEKGFLPADKDNIENYLAQKQNVIAIVNKVDHVTKDRVFEILTALNNYPALKAVVPLSALRNKNTAPVIFEIKKLLTDTVKYFEEDAYTDRSVRFMTAEIIREKALRLLDKEVPYGIGVDVHEYKHREGKDIIDISADIVCEKSAHKPIIIGKGGEMLKKIATYSRQDIENMTGTKVFLTLFVKVKDDWRDSNYIMKELGYEFNE